MSMKAMDKPFDVCIFGASGFTGKFVLRTWLKIAQSSSISDSPRLAIAGRSRSRLEEVLQSNNVTEAQVPIILADVDHYDSLLALCQQAKLILNCVGPFRFWGEPVVKACAELGVDYLDICGEPEFMERMELSYGETAKQNGALIVSACGFDCIPAELGVLHAIKQFPPPGAPHSVDSFLSFQAVHGLRANYGTWESLVEGMGSAEQLRKLRSSRPKPPPLPVPGAVPKRKDSPYFEPRVQAFALPFPAADASVVRRTMQRFAREQTKGEACPLPAVHFAAYFTVRSRWHLLLTGLYGGACAFLAKFPWGRKLLLKHPGVFSHGIFTREGPGAEQIEGTSTSFLLFTKGFQNVEGFKPGRQQNPDREVVTRVHTPEPGYAATSTILVCSALSLLSSRGDLPSGVFPPGYVFARTDLEARLQENGVTFSVLNDSSI